MASAYPKHTNRRQYHSNRLLISKVISKSVKLAAILEKVSAI